MHLIRNALFAGLFALALGTSAKAAAPSLLEDLGRGVVAVRTSPTETFVSWRVLGTDPVDVTFNLYRSTGGAAPVLLNGAPLAGASHFVDASADLSQTNSYSVAAIFYGVEQPASASFTVPANVPTQQYLRVPLQRPADGTSPAGSHSYSPNDASVGDLDGDGEYELVIKWEPSNARDASNDGFTGNTYIDGYRLDGTFLWRIDLGVNVRAGPHDTPFFVYDLDGDGRAEVFMRTAEGTRDGVGAFVADPAKFQGPYPSVVDHGADRRGYPSNGRALVGPEFLTIFNGLTGAEITSTRYEPNRHPDLDFPTSQQLFDIWGDSFGNRQGRHYSPGVAYLDGQRPSIVMGRGYAGGQSGHPGRVALAAWNFRDGVLTPLWQVATVGGSGAHSAVVADIDGDGRDEIVYGQVWVRHDGTLIDRPTWGHGDALHVSQMDPDRAGQLVFMPHESPGSYGPNALSVDDGVSGQLVAGVQGSGDVGRGVAADIDPRFRGYEFWGSSGAGGSLYNVQSVTPNAVLGPRAVPVAPTKPSSINHVVWWDGDLLRELLDNVSIRKWDWNAGAETTIFAPPGILSNNGTKSNPSLQADVFGDWREEVIWRESTNDAVRIYTTTIPTSHRLYTLMHDRQYRQAIVSQNTGYNQPPHPSFFLGDGMGAAPVPNIVTSLDVLLGPAAPVFTGVTADTGTSAVDQITNDQTLVLHGTAEPNATVTVTHLGVGIAGTTTADGSGAWSLDYTGTSLSEGFALFSATATNGDGVTGAPTNPPFVVEIDVTPPVAPVIADVADEGGELVFVGTAEANGVVAVIADGVTELGTTNADAGGNWTLVYAGAPLSAEPHVFTATATDVAGNTGPLSTGVDVNTAIATPVVTGIADDTGASASDGITADTTLVFSGTAGAGDTVTLRQIGGAVLGSTTADGSGAWSFDYTGTVLADGFYAFSAAASNASGTSASSPSLLVTIDTVAPAVASIARQSPTAATSTAASITFRATFTEPMSGVSASSFTPVYGLGLSGTIVDVVPAGPAIFDVVIDLVGEGTVRLDVLAASAALADTAGNAIAADFTSGQVYTRALVGDGVWLRSTSGGLWSDNVNWANGVVADTVGRLADFSTLEIDEDVFVRLDSPRTLGNLVFGDSDIGTAADWIVGDFGVEANTLTLATLGGTPTITVAPLGLGATVTLDVALAGNQGLSKLGSGPLVLTKPNSLSGTLSVGGGGTLRLDPGSSLTVSGATIASGGSRLNLAGGSLTATGTLTVNAGGNSEFVVDSGVGTFATLATSNSAGGRIRINGGTVTATGVNLPRSNDNNLNFGAGFIVAGGDVTVNGIVGLGTNNSNGVMSVEGSGNLLVNGPVRVGDLNNSTRGGAMRVIDDATLVVTDTTEGIVLTRRDRNTTVANFDGGTTTTEKLSIGASGVATGSATVNVRGGALYLGSGGLVRAGTPTTNINLQSGILGAKAAWTSSVPMNLVSGGNIALRAADETDAPFDIALTGALGGTGGFTKTGAGQLTLGGTNTFTGGVVVSAGDLEVGGAIGPGADLVVETGGLLSGAGSIDRAVVLNSGGTIMPGTATAGTQLTVASLTWNAGGALAYDLDADSNRLAVTGAFTKGGDEPHEFVFNAGSGIAADVVYTLVTFDSTDFTASDFTFDTLAPGLSGEFTVDAGAVTFRVFGPPIVLDSPQSATVLMGGTATFSVVVADTPSPTYQWFKDGMAISGATDATLTVPNVRAADIGSYHVEVTNAAGATPSASATLTIADVSLLRRAPSLNSADVVGSLRIMTGGSFALNGNTAVTGSLFVPGTPNVVRNGRPTYGGTLDGTGSYSPSNYSVTLNGAVALQHVVRRSDPVALPVVSAPSAPTGTRTVHLNNANQSVGDWATVRNLTLNNRVGPIAVPAGAYGDFTANGGGFVLGVAGATQPSVYHFSRLVLNGSAQVQVVGPVIVVLGNGLAVNGGVVGNAAQPQWLTLDVFNGGLTLNGGGDLHGYVSAPSGTIMVNGNSVITGVVAADRLTLNGNAELSMPAP
jgi:rhamnogalacturonan endolyase